jgi:predicted ester cyclase
MSAEQNAQLDYRLYDEVWSKGKLAVADGLIAPDCVFDGQPLGVEGYKNWVTRVRHAFPDLQVSIESQVAAEHGVASRLTWRGTNTGEIQPHLIPGWHGLASLPTGKSVTWTAITIHNVVAGRLAEGWANADALGLLQQLGDLPNPPQPTP